MGMLCQERPKPLLPIAGKCRVIDFSLSNAVNSGLHNIAVAVDYQRQVLKEYLGKGMPWRLDRCGKLATLEPRTESYCGTSDAVYQNLSYIQASGASLVLVLAADHVYKMDYRRMLAFHENTGAHATVAVTPVPLGEAHRFGLVTADETGLVQGFVEKPAVPQSNLASMGIYVFSVEALARRLTEDAADPTSPHDFGHAIIPKMIRQDKVFAYKFSGYWQDIGEVTSYHRTNLRLAAGPLPFSLNGSWPVLTGADTLPQDLADRQGGKCLVGPRGIAQGWVMNSVLSQGVRIGSEAMVRDSVVMAGCVIGRHTVVENCILDEGVTIGEFCYVGIRANSPTDGGDITVLGRGVAVPARKAIGRGCQIYPGVRAVDLTMRVIHHGALVMPSEDQQEGGHHV